MKFYAGIGSRETPADVAELMTRIAQHLSAEGYTLRSGHASGADQAFEAGTGSKEIYIPWKRFNASPDGILPSPAAFVMAEDFHPNWKNCNYASKALHARNCHQVLGLGLDEPVEFVIAWTYDGTPVGGTGQALRIAEHHRIPIFNLFNASQRRYWELMIEPMQEAQASSGIA